MKKSRRAKPASYEELSQSFDDEDEKIVKAKRNRKKVVKKTSSNDVFEMEDQDIVDIKRGDKFIGEHYRPQFLKRWDGESNQLELQPEQLDAMSPMLRVYWEQKSKNMKCIIFCQMGKVQFLAFQDDAIRLHQIFKKPLKKFSKYLMVNFWSKEIELAKIQLFERRIPVLMLNENYEDEEYKNETGIFKREIDQVITPSIFLSMDPKDFQQRNMIIIYRTQNKSKCGVACLDAETNHIFLQQYEGTPESVLHQIRRVINRYRPVEFLVHKEEKQLTKMSKQICNPFVVEGSLMAGGLRQNLLEMATLSKDPIFKRMISLHEQSLQNDDKFELYPIAMALGLTLTYLKKLGLEAKIFAQCIFEFIDFKGNRLKPMFDAQVYENLQIFSIKDQPDSFGKKGTLYSYLNNCLTNSGQKLLKKWIDQPLRDLQHIKQRQQALSEILQKRGDFFILHKEFLTFEKLERRVGNIYHSAIKQSQEGNTILTKDIKFQKDYDAKKNPAIVKLNEIMQILKVLENAENFFKKLSQLDIRSKLLKKCCQVKDIKGLNKMSAEKIQQMEGIPSIEKLSSKIANLCEVNEETRVLEPKAGVSQIFDMEKAEVERINSELKEILKDWKTKMGVSKINFISVRARNEIEVNLSEMKNKKFPQLIFSSQTSQKIRYVTAQTTRLSDQLMQHEQNLAKSYQPFLTMIVKEFCSHKYVWDLYIKALSRLDVLFSLAKTSSKMEVRCMPQFVNDGLLVKKGHHPGLLQVKSVEKVFGNTLALKDEERLLLLTGPNMGGKSTLLRQTCLLAVMAQIGCFVPAEHYQCIIFDQIFCRIGASDRMIEGKSTFYVELEETKRIVDQATPESLVIIDQLGRGTSTYDGMALASAILKYMIEDIHCYTLFSTHYYPITTWYSKRLEVKCQKIGYYFKNEIIQFTYQLESGVAEKSFANQVAQMVGICQDTLKQADQRASQMEIADKLKSLMIVDGHEEETRFREFVKSL